MVPPESCRSNWHITGVEAQGGETPMSEGASGSGVLFGGVGKAIAPSIITYLA